MEKSGSCLPTYEESIGNISREKVPAGQRILDNITLSRSQNVSLVAGQHVIPEVERRARDGLSNTVVVILPSDIIRSQPEESSEFGFGDQAPKIEMMGFDGDGEITNVQLEGNMNRAGFWKQEGIIEDLRRVLKHRLSTSADIQRTVQHSPATLEQPVPSPTKPQRKGLFGRFSSSSNSNVPIQTVEVSEQSKTQDEPVKVEVRLEEICLRTTSPFGLYETINRQAVVVRVHVRC